MEMKLYFVVADRYNSCGDCYENEIDEVFKTYQEAKAYVHGREKQEEEYICAYGREMCYVTDYSICVKVVTL